MGLALRYLGRDKSLIVGNRTRACASGVKRVAPASRAHDGYVALIDVKPCKLVEVRADGTWYRRELRAWQKLGGRCRGDVT